MTKRNQREIRGGDEERGMKGRGREEEEGSKRDDRGERGGGDQGEEGEEEMEGGTKR